MPSVVTAVSHCPEGFQMVALNYLQTGFRKIIALRLALFE